MYKIAILSAVLTCMAALTLAQSSSSPLAVTYRLTFQPDSTNAESVTSEAMVLYVSPEGSKFGSVNHIYVEDSLKPAMVEQMNRTGNLDLRALNAPKSLFKYIIFKRDVNMIVFDKAGKKMYRYQQPRSLIEWQITSETETVGGYTCQKATGIFAGREYTAWFTPEIPISDGPYKFAGLPGLILKVADADQHYVFEMLYIQAAPGYDLHNMPYNAAQITQPELFSMQEALRQDPMQAISQLGATVDLTPEQERRIKAKFASRNNPLERQFQ